MNKPLCKKVDIAEKSMLWENLKITLCWKDILKTGNRGIFIWFVRNLQNTQSEERKHDSKLDTNLKIDMNEKQCFLACPVSS